MFNAEKYLKKATNPSRTKKRPTFTEMSTADIMSSLCEPLMIEIDSDARNPIVNMMPNMSLGNLIPKKQATTVKSSRSVKSKVNTQEDGQNSNQNESDAESAASFQVSDGHTVQDNSQRPTRLRMTSPRLAKIKSAQNMKRMAQAMSPKAPSWNCGMTARKKEHSNKSEDEASTSGRRGVRFSKYFMCTFYI